MTEKGLKSYSIKNTVGEAKIDDERADVYSNHARILISQNELFLDFYYIAPKPNTGEPETVRIQRIIFPLNVAKGLTMALANMVAQYESDHDITLPNTREKQKDDQISIWE